MHTPSLLWPVGAMAAPAVEFTPEEVELAKVGRRRSAGRIVAITRWPGFAAAALVSGVAASADHHGPAAGLTAVMTRPVRVHVPCCRPPWAAQPEPPESASIEAWYMDESTDDQRLPHRWALGLTHRLAHRVAVCGRRARKLPLGRQAARHGHRLPPPPHPRRQQPNKPCSLAVLRALGVLYWKLDADAWENDPRLAAIRKVMNYSFMVRRSSSSSSCTAALGRQLDYNAAVVCVVGGWLRWRMPMWCRSHPGTGSVGTAV